MPIIHKFHNNVLFLDPEMPYSKQASRCEHSVRYVSPLDLSITVTFYAGITLLTNYLL